MVTKTKPDCYKCKYKGEVPGSAHICCKHPANKEALDNPMLGLLSGLASVGRMPPMVAKAEGLKVVGNEHGISHGWFNHPFNFDPTWLESCDGFKKQKTCK